MTQALTDYLAKFGKVAIAYSGGVDSTFLVAMSIGALGEGNVLAVTIQSPLTPLWEVEFAKKFCSAKGIKHHLLDGAFVFEDDRIAANTPQRCYYCKRKILETMRRQSPDDHLLLTGTNASDELDYRPGIKAEEELGVKTPLRELRFTKETIRGYSKGYGIPGFDRHSSPCFATRIPYGEPITVNKVRMVEEAETFLRNLDFTVVRVRLIAPATARIEVARDEVARAFDLRDDISRQLHAIGFERVTIDLEGYRTSIINTTVAVR